MSQQPKRTMYKEKMTKQLNGTGTSSQSNLLRPEGGVHRCVLPPTHCSRSLLSNAVSALMAGHSLAPVHPQPGVNPLVPPTMVNRMVPAGAYQNPAADIHQRRMMMEMRQLQRLVPPGFRPTVPPPPGFPPLPQFGPNTRLELKPPSGGLSMPSVGSYHNQLSYSHGDQTRGVTGAVNPTVQQQQQQQQLQQQQQQQPQQQQQQVDKGKRPLLADQANPNYNPLEKAPKKRAVENSSSKSKYNPITKRMMDMKAEAHRNGIELLQNMPSVSVKRVGPNARKVQGFLYNYGQMLQDNNNGDDVRIMCSCHGNLLSPAEFVRHAGGGDVAEPMRHISVNVMVSAPPVTY